MLGIFAGAVLSIPVFYLVFLQLPVEQVFASDLSVPYHLDAAKQAAGRIALRFTDEMEARVKAIVLEREKRTSGASRGWSPYEG